VRCDVCLLVENTRQVSKSRIVWQWFPISHLAMPALRQAMLLGFGCAEPLLEGCWRAPHVRLMLRLPKTAPGATTLPPWTDPDGMPGLSGSRLQSPGGARRSLRDNAACGYRVTEAAAGLSGVPWGTAPGDGAARIVTHGLTHRFFLRPRGPQQRRCLRTTWTCWSNGATLGGTPPLWHGSIPHREVGCPPKAFLSPLRHPARELPEGFC
jgi:hypothetical protein